MQKRTRATLAVETLETREMPSAVPLPATPLSQENFDHAAVGTLPSSWAQWSSPGTFSVSTAAGNNHSAGLGANGTSGQAARTWLNTAQPANVQANVQMFVDSLVPAQLLVRGRNLATAAPSYYAVSVTRGLQVKLQRTLNGVTTTLGHVQSAKYLSGVWLQVSLQASGANLQAYVERLDTRQYLNSHGQWQTAPVAALNVNDHALPGGGQVGLSRAPGAAGPSAFDNFSITGINVTGTAPPIYAQESFNHTSAGALPVGWSQWSNAGAFAVTAARSVSPTHGLEASGGRGETDRAWLQANTPADAQVSAAVYLASLTPAQVLLRGSGLDTAAPSYYALAVTRGLQLQLLRVAGGASTVLGSARSAAYLSGQWVQLTLQASGSRLLGIVQRLDTRQYLTPDGHWQSAPVAALSASDTHLAGAGQAGLARGSTGADSVLFDNVSVAHLPTQAVSAPTPAPAHGLSVAITAPANGATLSRPTTIQAAVASATHVDRVDFYVDGVRLASDSAAPYSWMLDPSIVADGAHTVTAIAYDHSGATAQASLRLTTHYTPGPGQQSAIPRHYSWIRVAELAYSGTSVGAFEQQLLRNSVDLVIPNSAYLDDIQAVAPRTPQLIYTNVSSIYSTLLTDWDNWADAHHVSREAAFYHVSKPTHYAAASASSQPVNWFWGVYQGGGQVNFTDLTFAAHTYAAHAIAFGGYGTSLYLGYPEQFREINFSLATPARNGWSEVLEYPTAVDANGNPTAWATLHTLTDTTHGLTRTGQLTFEPPANWVRVSINGPARLFYVRLRTVADGTPPLANTVLGRDYTGAHGGSVGVIPVFDYAADANHDGYLNNAEYARAAAASDYARFAYESRLFLYGAMRPATNPASAAFRSWAIDYHSRVLKAQPLADGLFVDNSSGKPPPTGGAVRESVDTYATDYGTLLGAIGRAVAPHLVLGNTAGGGPYADRAISQGTGYFEEFAIRPLASSWQQFEEMAALIAHRQSLRTPAPYAVLDSLPTGGSPTDPRTQLATLAYYYLLGDPRTTFLDFYGGYEPAGSWSQHWSAAATFNVGQPQGSWSLFASGTDPSDRRLKYRVYQRPYSNALVLYRPLAHTQGVNGQGSLGSASAVTFQLGSTYRPLRADGTLGAPVSKVSLRDGEGAILVKV